MNAGSVRVNVSFVRKLLQLIARGLISRVSPAAQNIVVFYENNKRPSEFSGQSLMSWKGKRENLPRIPFFQSCYFRRGSKNIFFNGGAGGDMKRREILEGTRQLVSSSYFKP